MSDSMGDNLIKTVILFNNEEEAHLLEKELESLSINLEIIVLNKIEQFIFMIASDEVDCFILDWKYQNFPVIKLIEKLRKSLKFRHTPIIVMTDHFNKLIPAQYSSLNIDLTISRPFKISDFQTDFIKVLSQKFSNIIPEHFNILIADDNPGMIEIMELHLEQLRHSRFTTCLSLEQAKKCVEQNDYDLLMLDWDLGDGTCIDLIEYIRAMKDRTRLNQALIIVISGRNDVDDIMTLLKYDVKDYIVKPFEYIEFEEKLIYALKRNK